MKLSVEEFSMQMKKFYEERINNLDVNLEKLANRMKELDDAIVNNTITKNEEKDLENIKQTYSNLNQQKQDLLEKIEQIDNVMQRDEKTNSKIEELEAKNTELENEYRSLENEYKNLVKNGSDNDILNGKGVSLRKRLIELMNERNTLNEELSTLKQSNENSDIENDLRALFEKLGYPYDEVIEDINNEIESRKELLEERIKQTQEKVDQYAMKRSRKTEYKESVRILEELQNDLNILINLDERADMIELARFMLEMDNPQIKKQDRDNETRQIPYNPPRQISYDSPVGRISGSPEPDVPNIGNQDKPEPSLPPEPPVGRISGSPEPPIGRISGSPEPDDPDIGNQDKPEPPLPPEPPKDNKKYDVGLPRLTREEKVIAFENALETELAKDKKDQNQDLIDAYIENIDTLLNEIDHVNDHDYYEKLTETIELDINGDHIETSRLQSKIDLIKEQKRELFRTGNNSDLTVGYDEIFDRILNHKVEKDYTYTDKNGQQQTIKYTTLEDYPEQETDLLFLGVEDYKKKLEEVSKYRNSNNDPYVLGEMRARAIELKDQVTNGQASRDLETNINESELYLATNNGQSNQRLIMYNALANAGTQFRYIQPLSNANTLGGKALLGARNILAFAGLKPIVERTTQNGTTSNRFNLRNAIIDGVKIGCTIGGAIVAPWSPFVYYGAKYLVCKTSQHIMANNYRRTYGNDLNTRIKAFANGKELEEIKRKEYYRDVEGDGKLKSWAKAKFERYINKKGAENTNRKLLDYECDKAEKEQLSKVSKHYENYEKGEKNEDSRYDNACLLFRNINNRGRTSEELHVMEAEDRKQQTSSVSKYLKNIDSIEKRDKKEIKRSIYNEKEFINTATRKVDNRINLTTGILAGILNGSIGYLKKSYVPGKEICKTVTKPGQQVVKTNTDIANIKVKDLKVDPTGYNDTYHGLTGATPLGSTFDASHDLSGVVFRGINKATGKEFRFEWGDFLKYQHGNEWAFDPNATWIDNDMNLLDCMLQASNGPINNAQEFIDGINSLGYNCTSIQDALVEYVKNYANNPDLQMFISTGNDGWFGVVKNAFQTVTQTPDTIINVCEQGPGHWVNELFNGLLGSAMMPPTYNQPEDSKYIKAVKGTQFKEHIPFKDSLKVPDQETSTVDNDQKSDNEDKQKANKEKVSKLLKENFDLDPNQDDER